MDYSMTVSPLNRTQSLSPKKADITLVVSSRKTRASKPKVRTGCLTCKIRRVKCDEIKPKCKRCVTTGRECGGYLQPGGPKIPQSSAVMDILLRKSPDTRTGSPAELSALEFFHWQAAPQLASFFDADFWTRLVFQVSDAEDAIKHAIIALGSLARQQGEQGLPESYIQAIAVQEALQMPDPNRMQLPLIQKQQGPDEQFALLHYNKAIAELAGRIGDPDVPVEVVLLSCILFVCLEFLRGNLRSALEHYKSGMNVILSSLSHKYAIGPMTTDRIRQNMLPFFCRLSLLSTIAGNDAEAEYVVSLDDAVPKTFVTMRQARDSLVHLMNHSVRLIRRNRFRRYLNLVSSDDIVQQMTLHRQLEKWEQLFESLLLSERITASELDGARVLQLHHILANIWPSIALTPDESKNDEWNQHFERAVSLAEAVQESESQVKGTTPSFLFDMEIVSPLYFIIAKCRHPLIRRRATTLLRLKYQREGVWNSQLAAILSERLMAFEEANLNILDGSELPAECDRIHTSHIEPVAESQLEPQRFIISHYYRPEGLDGPWKMLCEEITITQGR